MRATGLFHATLPAFDLARAERFYREVFGSARHATSYFPEAVVFLALGNAMLHLIRYDAGPVRPAPATAAEAGHREAFLAAQAQAHVLPTHLAIAVDDLEAARAQVTAAGGRIVQGIETRPDGLRSLFFLDPEHNWVELVQH